MISTVTTLWIVGGVLLGFALFAKLSTGLIAQQKAHRAEGRGRAYR